MKLALRAVMTKGSLRITFNKTGRLIFIVDTSPMALASKSGQHKAYVVWLNYSSIIILSTWNLVSNVFMQRAN